MHGLARDMRTWVALAVLGLVVGLIGPFGTFEMLPLLRIAYWSAVVLVTGLVGTFVAGLIERLLAPYLGRLPRAVLGGALAGLPIGLAVALVNLATFGWRFQPIDLVTITVYCVLISAAVTVLSAVFEQQRPLAAGAPDTGPPAPALLARLPLPQRGRLLHIAVADHYVEVTTDRGRSMLLLRLSDAIRETAPVPGLQVHRSHWVAVDAVRRATRQAGKPVLELETGAVIPVSRTYLGDVRAAGLLP